MSLDAKQQTMRNIIRREAIKEIISETIDRIVEPKVVEERSPEVIPIRTTVTGFEQIVSITEMTVSRVKTNLASIFETDQFDPNPPFPRWSGWKEAPDAVKIRDVLDVIIKTFGTRLKDVFGEIDYSSFYKSTENALAWIENRFRDGEKLRWSVLKGLTADIEYAVFENVDGGIDIVARVQSQSNPNVKYPVIFSVKRTLTGTPVIVMTDTCPVSRLLCKHKILLFTATFPHILAGMIAITRGISVKEAELEAREVIVELANEIKKLEANGYKYVHEALVYYILKLLKYNGMIYVPLWQDDERITTIVNEILDKKNVPEEVKVETKETIKKVEINTSIAGKAGRIVWTEEIARLREKVLDIIADLQKKFGLPENVIEPYPKMLVFALVMSGDYTKPPIVLHIVGDPGTFKTKGSELLSRYLRIPVLEITATGNPVNAYMQIVRKLAEYTGIGYNKLVRVVGGIIPSVIVEDRRVTVSVNLHYLMSLLMQYEDWSARFRKFIEDISSKFAVSFRRIPADTKILTSQQLSSIEDLRYVYWPVEGLGYLKVYDAFDHYVVLIDEGARNPRGLEMLLTDTSATSINESRRVFTITDNKEPHVDMASNERYAPLFDRMYTVFTTKAYDEIKAREELDKQPSVTLDGIELLTLARFVRAIPVPEDIMYIVKMVENSLAYRYTLYEAPGGGYFLQPIRRGSDTDAEVVYDVFEGFEFKYLPSGRFRDHIILLSQFNAFLAKHERVEVEDVKDALQNVIASRVVVEANDFIEYINKVYDIVDKSLEFVDRSREILRNILEFVAAIVAQDYERANEIHNKMVEKLEDDPAYAPAIMSAIDLLLSTRPDLVDPDKLPTPLAYTVVAIANTLGKTSILLGRKRYREYRSILRGG